MWWALEHAGVWGCQMSHFPKSKVQISKIWSLQIHNKTHLYTFFFFFLNPLSLPHFSFPPIPTLPRLTFRWYSHPSSNSVHIPITWWAWNQNKALQHSQTSRSNGTDAFLFIQSVIHRRVDRWQDERERRGHLWRKELWKFTAWLSLQQAGHRSRSPRLISTPAPECGELLEDAFLLWIK